jgi:hypothetical protein
LLIRALRKTYYRFWLDVPVKVRKNLLQDAVHSSRKQLQALLPFFKPSAVTDKGIVLAAEVREIDHILKIAALSKVLSDKNGCGIKSYNVYIHAVDNYFLDKKDFLIRGITNKIKDPLSYWYQPFTSGQLHNNSVPFGNKSFVKAEKKRLLSQIDISNLDSINELTIDNVLIGDLIYDTYLRFFHQPTITEVNEHLELIIEWAVNIYYSFKKTLDNNPVKYFVTTYTAYIHFGIATRLCLSRNIKVYSIASSSYKLQLISKDFPFHNVNHSFFVAEKQLNQQQFEKTKQKFEARFQGGIDAATSYMRQSAFSDTPIPEGVKDAFSLRKRNVVIYVHDFYDSPHVFRKLAFPDLYQFVKETLESLRDVKDTTIFIKTHPNSIKGSKEQTIALVNSLHQPHFIVLDEAVNNRHIIELKPDLIATARGTVCMEMAYIGIPTVALYDNVFVNFKFTHTCYSKAEYFDIIKGNIQPNIDFDKNKILSFYYQAYIEKMEGDTNGFFSYLSVPRASTYDDGYAEYILEHKEAFFSEKFINEFAPLV